MNIFIKKPIPKSTSAKTAKTTIKISGAMKIVGKAVISVNASLTSVPLSGLSIYPLTISTYVAASAGIALITLSATKVRTLEFTSAPIIILVIGNESAAAKTPRNVSIALFITPLKNPLKKPTARQAKKATAIIRDIVAESIFPP